jgi:hypothetical protein
VLGEASIGFVLLYHLSRQTGAALIHSKFHYKLNEIRAKTKTISQNPDNPTRVPTQMYILYVVSLKRRGLATKAHTYIYACFHVKMLIRRMLKNETSFFGNTTYQVNI